MSGFSDRIHSSGFYLHEDMCHIYIKSTYTFDIWDEIIMDTFSDPACTWHEDNDTLEEVILLMLLYFNYEKRHGQHPGIQILS